MTAVEMDSLETGPVEVVEPVEFGVYPRVLQPDGSGPAFSLVIAAESIPSKVAMDDAYRSGERALCEYMAAVRDRFFAGESGRLLRDAEAAVAVEEESATATKTQFEKIQSEWRSAVATDTDTTAITAAEKLLGLLDVKLKRHAVRVAALRQELEQVRVRVGEQLRAALVAAGDTFRAKTAAALEETRAAIHEAVNPVFLPWLRAAMAADAAFLADREVARLAVIK